MTVAMQETLTDEQWAKLLDEIERGVDEGSWYAIEEELNGND